MAGRLRGERSRNALPAAATGPAEWGARIELAPRGESVAGSLVLPFGLSFAVGAGLQVDDKTDQAMLPFSTCLPIGCVVRVDFDAAMVEAMRTGNQLTINVRADGAAEPTEFSISLKGFSAALERTRALLAS